MDYGDSAWQARGHTSYDILRGTALKKGYWSAEWGDV